MPLSIPVLFLLFCVSLSAELPLYQKPSLFELSGSCGGRLDETPWSSRELRDKVTALYYIDPDKADLNEPLFTALKTENFPKEKIQAVAIINMKATWLPNAILTMILRRKQKKYSFTTYVKDNCKLGIRTWHFNDHSSDVLLFNRQGEVIYSVDGMLTDTQIREAIDLVWSLIGGKEKNAAR